MPEAVEKSEARARLDELRLTEDELHDLTGYRQPARQLDELRRQGFFRARRLVTGAVLLERAHYDAVCAGATAEPAARGRSRRAPAEPKLMSEA